jgi:hypothetical protein
MARKARGKAYAHQLPVIYPDSVRPPRMLPDAKSLRDMGLELSAEELEIIRMAMAINAASRQPKLTWKGWRHIAVALDIGRDHALRTSGGRDDTPGYRRVMHEFLRKSGFFILNKDDRAQAVRLLPYWDEIDEWRNGLSGSRQQALNNPREVWRTFCEERGDPSAPGARRRPAKRRHRQYPTLLEQAEALAEQLEMAEERAARAERETEYFAALFDAVTERAKLDEDDVAEIRAKVRAAHEAEADRPS